MQEFDHPNVLKLTGVCLDGGPAPFILMPLMINGSLLSYLKQERDKLVLKIESDDVSFISGVYINFFYVTLIFLCHIIIGNKELIKPIYSR